MLAGTAGHPVCLQMFGSVSVSETDGRVKKKQKKHSSRLLVGGTSSVHANESGLFLCVCARVIIAVCSARRAGAGSDNEVS